MCCKYSLLVDDECLSRSYFTAQVGRLPYKIMVALDCKIDCKVKGPKVNFGSEIKAKSGLSRPLRLEG